MVCQEKDERGSCRQEAVISRRDFLCNNSSSRHTETLVKLTKIYAGPASSAHLAVMDLVLDAVRSTGQAHSVDLKRLNQAMQTLRLISSFTTSVEQVGRVLEERPWIHFSRSSHLPAGQAGE